VLYGSFPDRLLAYDALKKLPENIQVNRPHLRTIGGILEETHKK
jgi:septal ring-binding cell division protein DamX